MIYKYLRARAAAATLVVASFIPLFASSGCSSEPAGSCEAPTQMCTPNTCYDVSKNSAHCGECDNSCATGSSCVAGACQCDAGQSDCGNGCISTSEDAANCGACGTACEGATPFCSQGACSATCAGTVCGTACVDLQTSVGNCGVCGTACTAGKTCQAGACVCPVGATCDDGGGSGGAPGGTGGVGDPGTGGLGDPGTGGGTPGTGGGEGSGLLGGYHEYGDWAGFAFTFTDTANTATITPTSFEDMVDQDGPYCVSGTVGATMDYSSIAALGFNTSQPKTEDAPVNTIIPQGDGLFIDITVAPGSEQQLRVQLEDGTDPSDPDAENHRWCSNFNGSQSDTIPWDSFSTKCWCDPASIDESCANNTPFDSRAIAKVIIYVPDPGAGTPAPNFDFCVNDIGPANVTSRGTGAVVADCGNTGVNWSDTGLSGFQQVNAGDYQFQANGWHMVNGNMSIDLLPGAGFRMTSQSCTTDDDSPCSFPSVYVGTDFDGERTTGFTPTQIGAINSVPTCLGWSSGGSSGQEYNVTYDVWFNSNAQATEAQEFLMVWFHDPPSYQPGGMFPSQQAVLIGDQSWEVWRGPNHQQRSVVSYVLRHPENVDGMAYDFDLKDFIDDAVDRGFLSPDLYLISVMGGLEIWGGAQGAAINGFRAQVQ